MAGIVKQGAHGRLGSEMSLLENLLPSVLVNWTPLSGYGYSERHALLFRLTSSIEKTVHDALRERRLKMTPSRFLGGAITLWRDSGDFRIRDHIELIDDIPRAFSEAFCGNLTWKLMIVVKKHLALLVCDSLLLPVFANAANISSDSRFLKVSSVYNGHPHKTPEKFSTHFFHQDPIALEEIATKCASSVESVLVTILIESIQNLQEDFGFLLLQGSKAYEFESLPYDPVARIRHFTRSGSQMKSNVDASKYKVANLTIVKGNSENNLVWHLTSSSHHICLSIDVVDSEAEGWVVNLSSNYLRQSQLRALDESFNSNLTYLVMTLRIPWPDTACLDAKLDMHLNAITKSLTS